MKLFAFNFQDRQFEILFITSTVQEQTNSSATETDVESMSSSSSIQSDLTILNEHFKAVLYFIVEHERQFSEQTDMKFWINIHPGKTFPQSMLSVCMKEMQGASP